MNLKQVQALSNEELRIKVAGLCGYVSWCDEYGSGQWEKDDKAQDPPNYPVDLNAMYEAETVMIPKQYKEWNEILERITIPFITCMTIEHQLFKQRTATARQRAEAFVLTMEKDDEADKERMD